MPPKAPPKVPTRAALLLGHTIDTQINPPLKPESSDNLEDADVAQLREQIRTLSQGWKDDQETLKLILEQLTTLAVAQGA
jgi:hypothetical protein